MSKLLFLKFDLPNFVLENRENVLLNIVYILELKFSVAILYNVIILERLEPPVYFDMKSSNKTIGKHLNVSDGLNSRFLKFFLFK